MIERQLIEAAICRARHERAQAMAELLRRAGEHWFEILVWATALLLIAYTWVAFWE